MLETLDAEPLFYPLSKGDPCELFSPCFWCHDYNTQPRKQLFEHLRVKKKKKKKLPVGGCKLCCYHELVEFVFPDALLVSVSKSDLSKC